jgi:transcriptional regulator GlxA family with amidase domain
VGLKRISIGVGTAASFSISVEYSKDAQATGLASRLLKSIQAKLVESVMSTPMRPLTVAVAALPDVTASTLYGIYDLFSAVGRDWEIVMHGAPGQSRFAPVIVAADARPHAVGNGVVVQAQATFADCGIPDIVCLPDIFVAPGTPLAGRYDREIEWVRRCYAGGALFATACAGALLLAEAGLLDGQDATLHWAYCDAFKKAFPHVRLHPERALVASGDGHRIVMAGGGTSWQDLTLYLIARFVGVEEALQVAKVYLINWHEHGQQPFAALARTLKSDDAVIARCQEWVARNYDTSTPVATMAQTSGLSERAFNRRFSRATGLTPLEYVHTLRLEEAKHLLERADTPVEEIAQEVGYEDASFFSRLFRRNVGITPAQYRKRFGTLRKSLEEGVARSRR